MKQQHFQGRAGDLSQDLNRQLQGWVRVLDRTDMALLSRHPVVTLYNVRLTCEQRRRSDLGGWHFVQSVGAHISSTVSLVGVWALQGVS